MLTRRSATAVAPPPFLTAPTAALPAGRAGVLAFAAILAVIGTTFLVTAPGLTADLAGSALCASPAAVLGAAATFTATAARLATTGARVFLAGTACACACAVLLCLVGEACFDLRGVGIAVPYTNVRTRVTKP